MSDSKFVKANERIAEGVTRGFQKIEDAFVDKSLTREGESVEDAKKRMEAEQAALEEADREAAEMRTADQQARVSASNDASKASVLASRNMGEQ